MTSRRGFEAALLLSLALAAIEMTVVATAVPSIARDLGSFALFPWLFVGFLLAQAVTTPIFGSCADVYGRKPMLIAAIAILVGASALAAVAWSMQMLIVARVLQGVGAGGIQPLVVTLAGDSYSVEERGRIQARFSSVSATAALAGPLVGGLLAGYLSWRWIFLVNLPVGALAILLLLRSFDEVHRPRRETHFDVVGASLLTAGFALVVFALLAGGVTWPWRSPAVVGCLAAGLVFVVLFLRHERRTQSPLLPPWLVSHRVLVGAGLAAAWTGVTMTGVSAYLPVYAQGVSGLGPIAAGFALTTMLLVWPLAAASTPRLYGRFGFRDASALGGLFCVAGAAAFFSAGVSSSLWVVTLAAAFVGVGFGIISTAFIVGIQSIVDWGWRGVVTGSNMFMRLLGQAVGAAVFGAVANTTLAHRLEEAPEALDGQVPRHVDAATQLFGGHGTHRPSGAGGDYLRAALELSCDRVFIGIGLAALATVASVLIAPRRFVRLRLASPTSAFPVEPLEHAERADVA